MPTNIKGFVFYVTSPSEITGTPVKKPVLNQFDLISDILTLPRLDNESNSDYKQRIMDVNVHPGDATYAGIINNITRDLGLKRINGINISLKQNSAGENIAPNPRVDILSNRIVLYSDWRPNGTAVIDRTIRTYLETDDGYFIDDLVSKINESDYFSAYIYNNMRPNSHSHGLIRSTSDNIVQNDTINIDNYTKLSANNIIENSITFNNDQDDVFQTEVTYEPTSDGEYQVDYTNGILYNYIIPTTNTGIYYHYANFPMIIDYSPIALYTFNDDDFLDELYNKEILPSGSSQNTLLTSEGSEIMHKLYKDIDIFWGK